MRPKSLTSGFRKYKKTPNLKEHKIGEGCSNTGAGFISSGCAFRSAPKIERGKMKTAIYIEDGVVQLVITPQTEFEKNALTSFTEKPLDAKIFDGAFYDCRGGWVRQAEHFPNSRKSDRSLIIQIKNNEGGSEK